jgi:hypothetical protein
LKKKLRDTTIPRLTWQLSSHHSEPENENSGYNSDSSTFCSALENDNDKEPDSLILMLGDNNPSRNQETSNNQNKIKTTEGASSLMKTDTQQMQDDHLISNSMCKDDDNITRVDDGKCSFSNSPLFHENSEDWSHLISPILSNAGINNTFLTTADTANNANISVSTNSKSVAPLNVTIEDPVPDVMSLSNMQSGSVAMSTDIFANSSSGMESKVCTSKNNLDAYEQHGSVNKSTHLPTDDEIVETGKSLFQTLNIVSTDSTSESSPDILVPQKMFSTCKKNSRNKNKERKLCNKHEEENFEFQILFSDATGREEQSNKNQTKEFEGSKGFHAKEVDSHARRKRQGTYPKTGKFQSGHQRKINQGKYTSKAESSQESIHRSRKQTGNARKKC